ncbi:MFS transporter [Paludisphaera rhizosphaerae]|uniref:MFS transporter n=1 Tax=Paludisphaera rhizosphaerae TaxID=2711216 RepID=UPI0013EDE98E|nr:MFS transporter [Paludisphaera rhizosphaerae]
MATTEDATTTKAPWYAGVNRYQWLVLAIASAGWIFDAFEGQIFNITREQMLGELLGANGDPGAIRRWGDSFLAVFLLGGTLGGVVFGSLADKFGRKPTMAATVLFYSIFSGLTYFATELWHVAALRFLVALGVGGEWAVAAALVAEVFPARARAHASGIFHATSVLGTWTAAIVGLLVGSQWRYAYLVGIAPALLVLWVRSSLVEPESWRRAGESGQKLGSFKELWGDPRWRYPALGGVAMAAIGLGTFWGVTVAGQDLARERLIRDGVSREEASAKSKFAYGVVETAGGGLGLLCFGPLAARLGRKPAFALMLICSVLIVPITCYAPRNYTQLLAILPLFGFFTLSTHAGFALYFPELFPDRLRATGTGVCFNGGRLLAAPILWFSGEIKNQPGIGLQAAVAGLGLLFLVGLAVLWFMPETKGRPLPE